MKSTLAGYGNGSESGNGSDSWSEEGGDEEDEEAAWIWDEMPSREKQQQREREMRMNNMGQEQQAKHFAREQNRDISEKIPLDLAKPTVSRESKLDSRLLTANQCQVSSEMKSSISYTTNRFSMIPQGPQSSGQHGKGNDELYGGGTEERAAQALYSDRFVLGPTKLGKGLGYEGGPGAEGVVQFEKDVSINPTDDVFGVGQLLDEAKRGVKRGLDTSVPNSRKRRLLDASDCS